MTARKCQTPSLTFTNVVKARIRLPALIDISRFEGLHRASGAAHEEFDEDAYENKHAFGSVCRVLTHNEVVNSC